MKDKNILAVVIGMLMPFGIYAAFNWGSNWYSLWQSRDRAKEHDLQYHVEYIKDEALIFLHHPNGSTEAADLSDLTTVGLVTAHYEDNSYAWFWHIKTNTKILQIPFYSIDPIEMLKILKQENDDIDFESSLKYAKQFEQDKFLWCHLWVSPSERKHETKRTDGRCDLAWRH